MGVDLVFQGREDKGSALRVHSLIFCLLIACIWAMIGFGFFDCRNERYCAKWTWSRRAHLVTQAMGGRGAVRVICCWSQKAFTKNFLKNITALITRLLKKVGYSCSWIFIYCCCSGCCCKWWLLLRKAKKLDIGSAKNMTYSASIWLKLMTKAICMFVLKFWTGYATKNVEVGST